MVYVNGFWCVFYPPPSLCDAIFGVLNPQGGKPPSDMTPYMTPRGAQDPDSGIHMQGGGVFVVDALLQVLAAFASNTGRGV